jgi:cysteinyl-tRNA synthetase
MPNSAGFATPAVDAVAPVQQAWSIAGVPVDSFHFQLQDVDLHALGQTSYSVLILDYSHDGSGEGAYTRQEISALRSANGDPRLVLAYLSIGEAVSYRYYWQQTWLGQAPPDWLQGENPQWAENYLVQNWDPAWQEIIFGTPESYLDRILAAGFDGVYLDKVDSYQSFDQMPHADQRMVDFILAMADYARQKDADFVVIPQNAVDLALNFSEFLHVIDGVGQEDVFYGYPRQNQLTDANFLQQVAPKLDQLAAKGKPVLTISYADRPELIRDNRTRCAVHPFLCFVTTLELNQLISNP